jgi:G3E family GTPase
MSRGIPVTVIGGYLGAGKTTLVNHLLRESRGRRLAVLVNDFGALPIDADLIEGREGDTLAIAGGCVCCSFGSDLVAALRQIAGRDPAPDHLLIEASGVALPAAVAAAATLVPGFANDGIVVLADAETVRGRAADRYLGDTIERQLRDAGLILLTKPDLVDTSERAATRGCLEQFAPVLDAERGDVPLDVLLGPGSGRSRHAFAGPTEHPDYETALFENLPGVDVERLALALTDPALGILRAKGILHERSGAARVLQVVGRRSEVTDASSGAAGRLVCIGLRGTLRREDIGSLIA